MIKKVVFLIIFIVTLTNLQPVYAQGASPVPSPTPVDYMLPYPGLLPDHPLYPVKMWRDKLMDFLTSGTLKKAELNLNQADKHMQAAYLLVMQKKGRMDLIKETLRESEQYFEQAITKAKEAKDQGIDNRDFRKRLLVASQKYQEVLEELEWKVAKEDKEIFVAEVKKIQKLADVAKEIK